MGLRRVPPRDDGGVVAVPVAIGGQTGGRTPPGHMVGEGPLEGHTGDEPPLR